MHEFYYKLDKHQENNTILVSTPQVSTQAKLTIGYYDDEYYYKKLRESFYDYVYYTQESFPCQENDQKDHHLVFEQYDEEVEEVDLIFLGHAGGIARGIARWIPRRDRRPRRQVYIIVWQFRLLLHTAPLPRLHQRAVSRADGNGFHLIVVSVH